MSNTRHFVVYPKRYQVFPVPQQFQLHARFSHHVFSTAPFIGCIVCVDLRQGTVRLICRSTCKVTEKSLLSP